MLDQTYTEVVNRFVVEYHEELPAEHKAQMRLNGMDPDNHWNLKWSFVREEDAIAQKDEDEQWYINFCKDRGYNITKTFRVRDLGAPIEIVRSVMF